MKKLFIFSSNILLIILSSHVYAVGSLAIDSNQGSKWGFAYNYSSTSEADQKALRECGSNCRIVKRFQNECAAYAADQSSGSTAYGWATASSRSSAQNSALKYCSNQGGKNCQVRVWGCE
ncbi:DUF4189 domain-containing protein [uncultured Vibrio sp.]|uniref:DUF4189 domain-containing protein n=1 Tax=uncultured Vibrio sp. TaxID=114054 RepID=UPI0025F1B2FE|nr:DUF4189 domain-containing protein [uncultured Vibrio sp.]